VTLVRRIFVFFRCVDAHDGNLSLTNLGVIVALGKIALATNFGFAELTAFFLALVSYSAKQWRTAKRDTSVTRDADRVAALEKEAASLRTAVENIRGDLAFGVSPGTAARGKR
jgi:hypothetical protein